MRREELKLGTSIEEAIEYLGRLSKTDELIGKMAEADHEWTVEDIRRAVRETGAFDFTMDDLSLIRSLRRNGDYMELDRRSRYLVNYLLLISNTEERIAFYRREIAPIKERQKKIRAEEKGAFDMLLFYYEKEV